MFDLLCTVTSSGPTFKDRSIAIDHHLYDNLTDTWIKQRSQPQPFINLNISVVFEDYKALGFDLKSKPRIANVPAMADTGCHSCLAGFKVIHLLGLKQSDIIPVTMKMHTAVNMGIRILGATVLRISGKDYKGNAIETRQITYITDDSEKIFISREACVALGIVPASFPAIGGAFDSNQTAVIEGEIDGLSLTSSCNHPRRQQRPPIPTKLPFPATEENHPRLRQYLLDHYKSSTFNICDHQPLPLMDGPPLHIMARHLRSAWNHIKSGQICLWSRRGRVRRIRNYNG